MKDVLMIAHFCGEIGDNGNNRFNYLADLFARSGFLVELVTSDFLHSRKVKRIKGDFNLNYKITMIPEPQYKTNVSAKRMYSHYMMGRNLKKYLENRKKPDLIYCAVPTLDAAKTAAVYAQKNKIRLIIDVQDLWPEAFKMVFHSPIVSDIILYPMKRQADYIYGAADEIVAVSRTYGKRAAKVNSKVLRTHCVFIGTELDKFDSLAALNKPENKLPGEIWIAYIGTLGHSYDIFSVIDALKMLQEKGIRGVKFIVMGEGPLKNKFQEYAAGMNINGEFTGPLPYGKMAGILSACDIAVNPIKGGSAGSIINKHADYAAAALPVVNTQESIEYRELLDSYNAGLNCINGDSADLAEKLEILCMDKELRETMGQNSRKLAKEKFDRKTTYGEIVELLNRI